MNISKESLEQLLTQIDAHVSETAKGYRHIVICGPSGSGKSTLIRLIIAMLFSIYDVSVSVTTRKERGKEEHGKDYFFVDTPERFHKAEYLESNEYEGNTRLYGTLATEVGRICITNRKRALFDVDVNGAKRLKEIFKKDVLVVYLERSLDVLLILLEGRKSETGETVEQINARIEAAKKEQLMVQKGEFVPDFILPYGVDVTPDQAVEQILKRAGYGILSEA